jgi:predicted ArsR family transcriptional regulator
LTSDAELLFPRREAEVLQQLAGYLKETQNEALLRDFFDRYIGERREAALERVEGLEGAARVGEAAAILSELGFMAVAEDVSGDAQLRLCHCPIRALVDATSVPCRAEIGFVRELLGQDLTRVSYIPSGDRSCCYRVDAA